MSEPSSGRPPQSGSESLKIRLSRRSDVPVLASLFREMSFSRLHVFGPSFARLLHHEIVVSRHTLCLVANLDGELCGYLSDAVDAKKFARGFVLRWGWLAALLIIPRLLQPRVVRTVLRAPPVFLKCRLALTAPLGAGTDQLLGDRRLIFLGK